MNKTRKEKVSLRMTFNALRAGEGVVLETSIQSTMIDF